MVAALARSPHAGYAAAAERFETVRIRGGARHFEQASAGADSISNAPPRYMTQGTIVKHGNDEMFIDHCPPNGIVGPLAYVFKGGFPSKFNSSMIESIEFVRSEIAVSVERNFNKDDEKFPLKLRQKLKTAAKMSNGEFAPNTLVEYYAYNKKALRAQGWAGPVDPNPIKNTWDQLRDYELGYMKALSNNRTERALAAIASRPLLGWRGFFVTANRPEEAWQKGGRTFWVTLPMQIVIGLAIASLAVAATNRTPLPQPTAGQ